MAVIQMNRINICALKNDRKKILEKLQSLGVIEINYTIEDDDIFKKQDTTNARISFEKMSNSLDLALDILQKYSAEKTSPFKALEGKDLVEKDKYQEITNDKEKYVKLANQIYLLDKEKAENTALILKYENSIESLNPWVKLEIPMDYKGTKNSNVLIGTMQGCFSTENILAIILKNAPDVSGVDVNIIHSQTDTTYVAIVCLKKDINTVENVLREYGFARPSQIVNNIPKIEQENLRENIKKCDEKILQISKTIEGYASERENLKILSDYYRVRAQKYEVLGQLLQSKKTFLISGFVPCKNSSEIEKYISENFNAVVKIQDIKDDEEMPILIKNNIFSESVESIVESYGLPKKGEIDPTTIMSFFYMFFFGMMLSDAAYGAIVAGSCFAVLKKFPRMNESMKKSIRLFMYCGVSTLLWGILFGGYFGNIVDIVSQKFTGQTITVPALWFIPLNNPIKLLIYSMLFGIIHLFVGLGLKGYMCIRDKKYLDFICDVVLWYMLITGLILMLIPSEVFKAITQTNIVFPSGINLLAKVLAIVGAVGIVLMSGRNNKNAPLRLALGAYDLYNITGWLSDVLSYSRLLALGLATGVIASVINQMGSMMPNNIFGIFAFIIIFIVGHLLNLAINILGAYVHTNRLQFVEFFGKFYEGGGKPFNPFKADTKYTDIKEEM